MKTFYLYIFLFGGIINTYSQISSVTEEFGLPASLNESSGIVFFNNKVITHNDSGGQNELYELDTTSELVTRTVTISNATNVDWEDLAHDDDYIYVGDIGNNSGDRTDLKIYKILKSDYLASTTVTAEIINFSYSSQIDFTSNLNNTEWDAEALISLDGSNLMLFSKNWVDGTTNAYLIPKAPGTYSISPVTTTLSSGGLITGGTYNPLSGKLFLVGYTAPVLPTPLQPFVWKCENFSGSDVFSGTNTQTSLSSNFSFEQTEAITYVDENSYYVTSESFTVSIISDYAKLISFETNDAVLSTNPLPLADENMFYPNPVKDILHVKNNSGAFHVEIFDVTSNLLFQGDVSSIDMSGLSKGLYLVRVNTNSGIITQKIIKQ